MVSWIQAFRAGISGRLQRQALASRASTTRASLRAFVQDTARKQKEFQARNKKTLALTFPVAVGGGGAISRSASGVTRAVKTVWQRATGNPLASGGIKGFVGRIGGRALGYGAAVEAFQYQKARASGKPFDWLPNLGSVAAFAVNPIAALGGTLFGAGQKGAADFYNLFQERVQEPFPQMPQWVPGFSTGETVFNFPQTPLAEISGQAPAGSYAPSVGVSVGSPMGAGFDPSFILALLGGLVGGYAIGRKRKKKRKYKKRKRR